MNRQIPAHVTATDVKVVGLGEAPMALLVGKKPASTLKGTVIRSE